MPSAGPGATGAAGAADHEPLTEELLARLLASATPQEYLDQTQVGERDSAAYLRSLLQQKGLTRADVLRACDVSPSFGYQVFQGTRLATREQFAAWFQQAGLGPPQAVDLPSGASLFAATRP